MIFVKSKKIVDLGHSGQKVKELSNEYGVSYITIYSWIKSFISFELNDGSSITKDEYIKNYKKWESYKRKI